MLVLEITLGVQFGNHFPDCLQLIITEPRFCAVRTQQTERIAPGWALTKLDNQSSALQAKAEIAGSQDLTTLTTVIVKNSLYLVPCNAH
jgi:hypothetical protein